MKKGNLEKWTDIDSCQNLLFFSQLVNELLFDYSIPSNRISTLNSHYLCIDAIRAINDIENNDIREGSLKPIAEEFYTELKKDPIFQQNDGPLNYFIKQQKYNIVKCQRVDDMNFRELKNSITAINKLFFHKDNYFNELKFKIIQIVKNNVKNEQQTLFRVTKSLLTELKNMGYSLKYIYMVMDSLFWNPKTIIDSPDKIELFFQHFILKANKYTVIFKCKKNKTMPYISCIGDRRFIDNLPEDSL